jgi:hypothetical protein
MSTRVGTCALQCAYGTGGRDLCVIGSVNVRVQVIMEPREVVVQEPKTITVPRTVPVAQTIQGQVVPTPPITLFVLSS